MTMPRRLCFLPALGLLLAGGACVAQTPQTYRIKDTAAAGDTAKMSEDFDGSVTMTLHSAKVTSPPSPYGFHKTEQYRSQTLAASNGHTDRERRAYTVYRSVDKGAGTDKTSTSLQGKTLLLERSGGQTKATGENGAISDADRKDLQDALNNTGSVFPDRALAIGDEWTPDSKAMGHRFGGAKDVTLRCKLLQVLDYEGHPCARIHYTMTAKIPLSPTASMQMNLQGDGYHAIDLQRSLSLILKGPLTLTGSITEEGTKFQLTGTGTATMKMVALWEKVGDKPVSLNGETITSPANP